MLETMIQRGVIFYVMGIVTALGILAKFVSHITVRKLVKEASEIQKSEHKLMKLIKAKFEHANMASDRVHNIRAFVEKYMYEYKVLGMQLESWRDFQGRSRWILLALGTLGAFGSYLLKGMNEAVFQYAGFTGILVVCLYVIQTFSNEASKLEAAKIYVVEYLENVCVHRIEKANQKLPVEEEKEREPEQAKVKDEQEMRIRAILEEFLA